MFNKQELKKRYQDRLGQLLSDETAFGEEPDWDARAFLLGPQAELLARMNAHVRGIDPGEPVNWRGL